MNGLHLPLLSSFIPNEHTVKLLYGKANSMPTNPGLFRPGIFASNLATSADLLINTPNLLKVK